MTDRLSGLRRVLPALDRPRSALLLFAGTALAEPGVIDCGPGGRRRRPADAERRATPRRRRRMRPAPPAARHQRPALPQRLRPARRKHGRHRGDGIALRCQKGQWCPGAELNHRHTDFQSVALPTELPGHQYSISTRESSIPELLCSLWAPIGPCAYQEAARVRAYQIGFGNPAHHLPGIPDRVGDRVLRQVDRPADRTLPERSAKTTAVDKQPAA